MVPPAPIREVATRHDLALSTLHYWERRGLVAPIRRAGQRWFDADQQHRIALIKLWQATGLMSLEDIATVLAGNTGCTDWREVIDHRAEAIDLQIERLDQARDYLRHLLTCPRDNPAAECPKLREQTGTHG